MTSQGMTECLHITDQTALLVGLYFTLYLQVIGRLICDGPQANSNWHFAVQKVQNLHQQTINYCLCCRSRSEVLDLSSLSYISHIVRKIKWKYRTWLNLHSHSTAGGFNKSVLLSNPYIPLKWGVLSKEKFSFEEKITYSHFIQPTTPLPVIICQNSDSLEIFSKIS